MAMNRPGEEYYILFGVVHWEGEYPLQVPPSLSFAGNPRFAGHFLGPFDYYLQESRDLPGSSLIDFWREAPTLLGMVGDSLSRSNFALQL
jgi:hypothetical protein